MTLSQFYGKEMEKKNTNKLEDFIITIINKS